MECSVMNDHSTHNVGLAKGRDVGRGSVCHSWPPVSQMPGKISHLGGNDGRKKLHSMFCVYLIGQQAKMAEGASPASDITAVHCLFWSMAQQAFPAALTVVAFIVLTHQ